MLPFDSAERREGVLLSAILCSLFVALAPSAVAQPTTHPGWPVTIQTSGATVLALTSVQLVDLWGDGTRRVILCWLGVNSNPDFKPGTIEIRRGDGTLERRIDFNGLMLFPAVVDREDDGIYEIVGFRVDGITMFGADGSILWNRVYVPGDPIWGKLSSLMGSVGELDGDGKNWIVAVSGTSHIFVFDTDGNLRPGWPVALNDSPGANNSTPSFVDLDLDGTFEILKGAGGSRIQCLTANGLTCPGWPYVYPAGATLRFDTSPVITVEGPGGYPYIVAVNGNPPRSLHVIDRFGQPVPPYPVEVPSIWTAGESYSIFEAQGKRWLAVGGQVTGGGYVKFHLFDLETAAPAAGWPFDAPGWPTCAPASGDFGQSGPVGLMFGEHTPNQMRVDAFDFSGAPLAGYPRTINRDDRVKSVAIGTLDGVQTTACWVTGTSSGSTSFADCFDVGVPWDRSKVQWGTYGYDLQHTSRFRRLGQIDRPLTCVLPEMTELPTSGATMQVRVCPRDASGGPLGMEQQIRLARRPVVGQFIGPMQYEAATGDYIRTYQAPVQDDSATIEFRVLVNEELDDTMPTVYLRGRPKISAWTPLGVPLGATDDLIVVSGTDFTPTASVQSLSEGLIVNSFSTTAPNTIEVRVSTTLPPGVKHLQVTAADGRTSVNTAPIFVYDPSAVTLFASKPNSGSVRLDWFGTSGTSNWTLERSATPSFAASKKVYSGPGQSFIDATPAPAKAFIWYYRVGEASGGASTSRADAVRPRRSP